MDGMIVVLLLVAVLLVFDLAVALWGIDSRDGYDSPEWERRRHWPHEIKRS